jgi:ethanolamine utilization protein EutQ (cupin superfamily)
VCSRSRHVGVASSDAPEGENMSGKSDEHERSGILRRRFDEPDETLRFRHGHSVVVALGGEEVWRSELQPGWSWDEDLGPYAQGATSCPLTHREVVMSGRIRYLMTDGAELEAGPGDVLFIPPGHRAWVLGDERCVLIDW